jgi:hypothetical protein
MIYFKLSFSGFMCYLVKLLKFVFLITIVTYWPTICPYICPNSFQCSAGWNVFGDPVCRHVKLCFHSIHLFVCLFVCLIGFYVTQTHYRSYGDVPAFLVEEELRCPSVYYFRHEREPK